MSSIVSAAAATSKRRRKVCNSAQLKRHGRVGEQEGICLVDVVVVAAADAKEKP